MTKAFLVAFLFLVHQVTTAQPETGSRPSKKIKVLSWNIYMLPHLVATHSGKRARAEMIGQTLQASDYDVILFQEAFHPAARKKILRHLKAKYPYQVGPANRKLFSLKANSGLWLFSRYPIIDYQSISYKNKYGVDALSRKGALLAEIDVEGKHIQIAGTHLQNCGPTWLRQAQCIEFYSRLLKPNSRDGVPQVICGDFNIDRYTSSEDYQFMIQALDAKDSNLQSNQYSFDRTSNDLHSEKGSRRDLIDYILYRSNGTKTNCTNTVVQIRGRWDALHSDLSDHYSLQGEINLSNVMIFTELVSLK